MLFRSGICTFAYKQFIIVIEMPKESTCFFVYTCLKHCTNRCTPIMKRALELNYLTQQTNGCTIGIDSTLGVTSTPTTTMAVAMGGPRPYFNGDNDDDMDNEKEEDDREEDQDEKLDVIVDYDEDIIEEFEDGIHFERTNYYDDDDDPLELTLSYTHPIVGLTQGEFCNILVNFMETAEALYDDLDSVQEKAPTAYTNDEIHHGRKEDKEDGSHEDCGSSLSSSLGGAGGHRHRSRPPLPSSGNSSTTTNYSSHRSSSSVRSISPPLSYHASFPPSPMSLEDKVLGVSNPFHIYTPPARKTHSSFDDDVHPNHRQRPDTPPPPPLLTLCDTVKVSNKKTSYFPPSPSPDATVDESKMAPVAITAMSFENLSTSKVTKSPRSLMSPLKIPTPKFATKIPTPKFGTTLDAITASSSYSSSSSAVSSSTNKNVFGNRVNGNFHVVQKQQQKPKRHDNKEGEEESSRSCQRPNSPAASRLAFHKHPSK